MIVLNERQLDKRDIDMKAFIIYDNAKDIDAYVCEECKQNLECDTNYSFTETAASANSYADTIECENCGEVIS